MINDSITFCISGMTVKFYNATDEFCWNASKTESNRKIWYFHYCLCARVLMRKEIGPTKPQYGFSESALVFVRDIAPGDIVGETRKNGLKYYYKIKNHVS